MKKRNNNNSNRIVYHINVSSDAGMDVNTLMLDVSVLHCLSQATGGEAFLTTNKHGFLVELPSKLSSTLETSNITGLRSQFSFLAGVRSVGVKKYEIQDSFNNFERYK